MIRSEKSSNRAEAQRVLNDILDEVDDSSRVEWEYQIGALLSRDKSYTAVVDTYVDYYGRKSESNLSLRKWFFRLSFILLFLLIAAMITTTVLLGLYSNDAATVITGVVASFAGTVSAILILPKIIGNYLFPHDEDKYIRKLIYNMRMADEFRRRNEMKNKDELKNNDD